MAGFIAFMQSMAGRMIRIVAGLALIAVGMWVVDGIGGVLLAILGTVPLIAGLAGICFLAPLFGYTLDGRPAHPQS